MTFETGLKRGVINHYGARKTNQKFGGVTSDVTGKRVARWLFNYDDLPDAAAHGLDHSIPIGSTILSARLRIITAFTSTSTTTDLDIGLQRADGTEIDNDGLVTAANATQTTIAVAGSIITGSGALIGKVSDATYAGELVVTPTVADLLTGRAEVIVEYMLPAPVQV